MNTKKLTLLAMYTTIALTIFMVESTLPSLAPVPGIKLGLANIVTLWILLRHTWKDAFAVLLMRILLTSMFAGQMISFSYSLCGGLLCFFAMGVLIYFLGRRHIVFISVIGAVFHNTGQILAALLILQSMSILAYLPALLVSAVITGTFTGLCAFYANRQYPHFPD